MHNILQHQSGHVKLHPTSYCHFGSAHRKRTFVVSNVPALRLPAPCPNTPCEAAKRGAHSVSVRGGTSQSERNAIPFGLVETLAQSWARATPWATHRIVVDAFSGFGSLGRALEQAQPSWTVLANDVVRGRDHVDLLLDAGGRPDQLHLLVTLAVLKARRKDARLDADWRALADGSELAQALFSCKVAVWIHLSTPCETYSMLGGDFHRCKGAFTPQTQKAETHDSMNTALFAWLERNAFSVFPRG